MTFRFIPAETVSVPEIPFEDQVTLPAGDTAVIVVDMQNDFVKPEGSLMVAAAQKTVPNIQALITRARQAGSQIVYTQDTMFPDDREFDIWPEHCLKGTWGWQIIPELQPDKHELVCRKNRYDGFYGTWLDHFLNNTWQIKNLVIVGTVANICVLHTAASAGLRWYRVIMPADGVSANTEFDQALTLRLVSSLYNGQVVQRVSDIQFAKEATA